MHGRIGNWKTKADPFSLESLIAWLEMQPADKTYNWSDCEGGCLIGLYGAAMGWSWHDVCTAERLCDAPYYRLSTANGCIAYSTPHTFSGALSRARAALEAER